MTNISGQLKYLLYLSTICICEKHSVLLLGNNRMQLKYLLYLSTICVCEKCSVPLFGNDKMQSTKYNRRENSNKNMLVLSAGSLLILCSPFYESVVMSMEWMIIFVEDGNFGLWVKQGIQ